MPAVTGVGEVTRAVLAVARELHVDEADGPADGRVLAEQVCGACVVGLDIDGAGVSLHTASTLRETLFASDPIADLLEDLQFGLGEGPCVEAAVTGRPVLVPDLTDSVEAGRWPVFTAAVLEQAGVAALFALPLQWGTTNFGVLDLYRRAPGPLPREQWLDVCGAAETAALLMLGMRADPDDHGWDGTWSRRAEVHQATGMIVAQLDISAADAFARLRAYAFAEQRLLVDVARDVVARRLRLSDDA